MTSRYVAIRISAACFVVGTMPASADAQSVYAPWWQTSCETARTSLGEDVAYVAFRRFPVTEASIDGQQRVLTFFSRGITIQMDGGRFTMDWADLSRVLVKQIGRHNSPLSLTIQFNSQTLGNAVFGNLELNCWRYLEDVIEKQAPGVIEGSPPRLHVPLHDKTGAVIPEPNG